MDPNDKAMDEAIINSLRDYEEPYEDGNWEIFNEKYKQENKKRGIFYISNTRGRKKYIVPAAAIILILLKLTVFDHQDLPKDKHTVNKSKKQKTEKSHGIDAPKSHPHDKADDFVRNNTESTAYKEDATKQPLKKLDRKASAKLKEENVMLAASSDISNTPGKTADKLVYQTENPPPQKEYLSKKRFNKDALETSVQQENDRSKGQGRWAFGVELNSSFTAKKMNYGAGVATQFKVSDNVSLGTGLVFANLNAANSISDGKFSGSAKRIGIETNMKAIDIPLNVIYHTKKGLYASVGFSSLSVLSEDKAFVYETERVEHRFVLDPYSGVGSTQSFVIKENYTESTKEKDFKGRSNLIFFNFSVGKIQKIGESTNISIEPFLKVPMGKLSSEDVKLTNAGLRLKFLF